MSLHQDTHRIIPLPTGVGQLDQSSGGTSRAAGFSSRVSSLDAARFVAALAVIWIHAAAFVPMRSAGDAAFIGRFAVPFFTFTAMLYATSSGLRQSSRKLGGYAWDRFLRIYLPFICWTALYLGFKFVQMRVLPNSAARAGEGFSLGAWILWDGGSYHLWFLPYICLMTVLAFGVGKLLVSRPQLNWPIIVAGSVGGIVWAIAPTPYAASDTLVLRFGWNTMPAALWAIALAALQSIRPQMQFKGTAWLIAGLWITITSIAAQCMPAPHLLLANLAGVGWAVVGLSDVRGKAVNVLQKFGSLAYGVYLFHIMPMGIIRSQAHRLHLEISSVSFAIVAMLLVAISSVVVSMLLSSWKWTAWLVPGGGSPPKRTRSTTAPRGTPVRPMDQSQRHQPPMAA